MSSCVCHITTSVVSPMYKKSHQSTVKKPRCRGCVLISRCNFAAWCVSDFSEIWWRWNTKFCSNEQPSQTARRRLAKQFQETHLVEFFRKSLYGVFVATNIRYILVRLFSLQCFDAVGWAAGRASACKNWVVGCRCGYLSGAKVHTRCYFNVRSKADISQLNLPHGRCRLAYGPPDATATHCLLLQ